MSTDSVQTAISYACDYSDTNEAARVLSYTLWHLKDAYDFVMPYTDVLALCLKRIFADLARTEDSSRMENFIRLVIGLNEYSAKGARKAIVSPRVAKMISTHMMRICDTERAIDVIVDLLRSMERTFKAYLVRSIIKETLEDIKQRGRITRRCDEFIFTRLWASPKVSRDGMCHSCIFRSATLQLPCGHLCFCETCKIPEVRGYVYCPECCSYSGVSDVQ